MNYKALLKNVSVLSLILSFGLFFTSCDKDDAPPAPTVKMVINSIDGFTIDIAAEAENATSWSWDYGDDNVSDQVGSHFYTYTNGGDYTITCTVTGEGGSATATADVHIATTSDLLTANTWVLSEAGSNGLGFHITSDLVMDMPVADVLGTLNSQRGEGETYDFTNEFDDEYVFNADNSYSVDYVNNSVLSGWVYAGTDPASITGTCLAVGMLSMSIDELTDATWTLHENENLTLNTVYDADQSGTSGGVAETVVFENVDYLTFTNGGFLGFKDYTSTAIIRSISEDELAVTVFFHSYSDGTLGGANEPSFFVNLTLKPKA